MKRRYNTRSSSKSKNGDEENNTEQLPSDQKNNTEQLPSDLVVDIILKSPIKSIAKFRCVSKLHASTIRGPNFTESFFTISSSRPNLLFTCLKDGETFFFSSPQPQNPSPVTPSFHMKFSINCHREMLRPIHGFVCGLNQQKFKGRTVTKPMICNPSTGLSLTLPRMRTMRTDVINYLGYDPIDKQFKILSMTKSCVVSHSYSEEHQVLTLETGKKKPEWRMIKCDIPHSPQSVDYRNRQSVYDGICINGVIYYLALAGDGFPDIVCFDIRSEKFHLIKRADNGMNLNNGSRIIDSTLVNYKGGLAKIQPIIDQGLLVFTGVELWVLQDVQKHQWSRYSYVLPPSWMDINAETKLCFVGTTSRGEIVMSPNDITDPFYLLYYNPETNTMTRVDIRGLEAFKAHKACIFLDHVENVKLLADV